MRYKLMHPSMSASSFLPSVHPDYTCEILFFELLTCLSSYTARSLRSMDNLTVGKILGAVAAHIASVTAGIDASTEVGTRCLGGRSLGQFFVFHSTFEGNSRYLGMQKAFGDDTEMFRVVGFNPPRDLDSTDYDKLVNAALVAADVSVSAAGSSTEPNPYLCMHANFPIIKWGRGIHHWLVTSLYTIVALGSMLGVAVLRWCSGSGRPGLPEVLYLVTFLVISGFAFYMLDVGREVCYIMISKNDVSHSMRAAWGDLKDVAHPGLPEVQPGMPRTESKEAFEDLKRGQVRIRGNILYVPVMAVRTIVEDDLASWLLLLNDLPGLLMLSGLFCLPDTHLNWGVAYGVAAYIQSRLQHAVAERYIKDAKTRGVFWFRKLKGYDYAGISRLYPLHDDSEFISSMSRFDAYGPLTESSISRFAGVSLQATT